MSTASPQIASALANNLDPDPNVAIASRPKRYLLSLGRWLETGARAAPDHLAWHALLLIGCAVAGAHYIALAAHATSSGDNDAAYYLGVARAIATTGRLREPIVWHYLAPPNEVVHPAFDYWQGLVSLWLVPWLRLFGTTAHVAFAVMAATSAASLVAFWFLVCRALPPRSASAQLLALVAFATSPAVASHRLDTETTALFHLVLVAALIAWAKRRPGLTIALAFLLMLTRADGVFAMLVLWIAALVQAHESGRLGRAIAMAALLVAAHVGTSWTRFGTLTPPGVHASLVLKDYAELYAYRKQDLSRSLGEIARDRWTLDATGAQVRRAWQTIVDTPFTPAPGAWIALAVFGAHARRGSRRRGHGLVLVIVLAASALAVAGNPVVFAPWRTLHGLLPALVLAGMYGIDDLLANIRRFATPRGLRRPCAAVAAATIAWIVLHDAKPYEPRGAGMPEFEASLRELDPTLDGGTVAAVRPWHVIATTRSPAIKVPNNGASAIEAAFRRYGVRWLILGSEECDGESTGVCREVRQKEQATIGGLELERVRSSGELTLYRVNAR